MQAGVVLAGSILAPSDFAVVHPYPVAGGVARSGRDGVAVVWLVMPNLRKSVGGERPQFPVKESRRVRRPEVLLAQAMLADEVEVNA